MMLWQVRSYKEEAGWERRQEKQWALWMSG